MVTTGERSAIGTTRATGLQTLVLWVFVIGFIVIYGYVGWQIWTATSQKPPAISEKVLAVAASLTGTMGTGFALALGIKKSEENKGKGNATIGAANNNTLLPGLRGDGVSLPLTVGVYAYFVIGLAAGLTYFAHTDETPSMVKGLAVAMTGYVLTVGSNAFGSIQASSV